MGRWNLIRWIHTWAIIAEIFQNCQISCSMEWGIKTNSERLKNERQLGITNITLVDILEAIEQSDEIVQHRFESFQPRIFLDGARHTPKSGSAWFMAASHRGNPRAVNISRISFMTEEATLIIARKYGLSREEIAYMLPNVDIRSTKLHSKCPLKVDLPCQPRKYRAYTGFCNNVQQPEWASSNSRYLRFLMPNYADGASSPRISQTGNFLPSARTVSLKIHKDADRPHAHLMSLTAIWGEFIAHDLAHTPQITGFKGSPVKCCNVDFRNFHPDCYPIRIPGNDPHYKRLLNGACQEYVRSSIAPRVGCTLGPREQMNQATSFLDASHIYGNSKERLEKLRLFHSGLLRAQAGPGGELLPSDPDVNYCQMNAGNFRCFKGGDDRVNEHLGLTTMHTLWLREHNRLAKQLHIINPHWSDETLFQEARRIVIAEIQHITYNEFLPVVLGSSVVVKYKLKPLSNGFYHGYDINVNSGIFNSVASAALWFFTSLMPKSVNFLDHKGRVLREKEIRESFYAPFDLYRDGALDEILRGFLKGKAQSEDRFINGIMTNRMFEDPYTGIGLDLAAQLIQKGRDHGIPGYVYYRELCGLGKITQFSQLNGTMEEDVIASLQEIYESVEDIDLFTGGLAELSDEGAVVSPTFACLLATQFANLKNGDRFWYENDLPPSSFTPGQLREIRKVTLSRIICDNSNGIRLVQPKAFLDEDPFLNAPMQCDGDSIPRLMIEKWNKEPIDKFKLSLRRLRNAIQEAKSDISRLHLQEQDLWRNRQTADPKSPVGTAFGFNKPKPQAAKIANASFLLQFATTRFLHSTLPDFMKDTEISEQNSRNIRSILNALPEIKVSKLTELPSNQECLEESLPCDHTSLFRKITGWCNNLNNPTNGVTFSTFKRLLPPSYQDGYQEPRVLSKDGSSLPSPRDISVQLHDDISVPHQRYTLLLMQYGQLLDHDLTHTPMNRGFENSILDCHSCDSKERIHPECWPIPISKGDPYFSAVNRTTGLTNCLPFTRSMPGQLTLGVREQLNQVTSYVDASHTYGSDLCEMKELREFVGGRLKKTRHPRNRRLKSLLPLTSKNPECKSSTKECFQAGDSRSSEQPGLAALHTVWMREHNWLARGLQERNPHWDDELLYQTARRILSAVTQHITYSEFLPRILGWQVIHRYQIELINEGYYRDYDMDCDATIMNEFSTAAFRFGHSLLKPTFKRFTGRMKVKEPSVQLRDTFFNPDILFQPHMIDELLNGLVNTPMENLDNFISKEVTNHLFEDRKVSASGMDLAALNIQRGRDHGLRSYNEYRAICNLPKAETFQDLKDDISPKLIAKLEATYAHVDDIDLFPGGLAEHAVQGGVVGPTFACIIAQQFKKLRQCDRFWYENEEPLTRFTTAQLNQIRKTSLSKLICKNGDGINIIQKSALDVPEQFLNPRVDCAALDDIDLNVWKDRVDCLVENKNITVGASYRITPCVMCTCTKEGPLCQSMKIDNCVQLSSSYSSNEILSDHVCKVQCAFTFRIFPFSLKASKS